MPNIVILISGRGSNMEAILHAGLPLRVSAVISNRASAGGLEVAKRARIPTAVVDHKLYASREHFDDQLRQVIESYQPDWVVLAGFMRVLTPGFVNAFPNRIVNIHPSLLPAFPGLDTHQRALDAGVKIHGATVHLVTSELDHGPIIAQAAVPVLAGDTAASLGERVLAQEHVLLPAVLQKLVAGEVGFVSGLDAEVVRTAPNSVMGDTTTTRADASLRAPWT